MLSNSLNFVQKQLKKSRSSLLAMVFMFITVSCAQTHQHQVSTNVNVLPNYVFSPSTDVSVQVEQTLITAKQNNQKALLVLGAQWCHDSKSLAKNFSTSQMQAILTENYEVLFIDVGYLEKGFDVVTKFDLPIYYGTPTVMVIDPNTNKILNRASMQKWLHANNVALDEYMQYFTSFAAHDQTLNESKSSNISSSNEMKNYLTIIHDFENEQAIRLKAAYHIISPLFKKYMENDKKEGSAEFNDKWQQVYSLRSRVQNDIQTLIAEAENNVNTGSSAALNLPVYPSFTWE